MLRMWLNIRMLLILSQFKENYYVIIGQVIHTFWALLSKWIRQKKKKKNGLGLHFMIYIHF